MDYPKPDKELPSAREQMLQRLTQEMSAILGMRYAPYLSPTVKEKSNDRRTPLDD